MATRSTSSTLPTGSDEVGETIIGSQIGVRGRIEGQEDLRVEGRVEGAISLTETLFVEASGIVVATVEAHDVVVSGIIVGDVTATNSLTLEPGAKLVGNISTPRLIIADGAAFKGDVTMGEVPAATRERARVAARREAAQNARTSKSTSVAKAAPAKAEPARSARTAKAPPRRQAAPAKAAAPARSASRSGDDDEVTVVVKHASLKRGQAPADEAPPKRPARKAGKKATKKAPKKKAKTARARVPARGKRRVSRR